MKISKGVSTFITLTLAVFLLGFMVQAKVVEKSFKGVTKIKLITVSGDCTVEKGPGKKVSVSVQYDYPEDRFSPLFEQQGDLLILKEDFKKSTHSGKSTWVLKVPKDTDLEIKSASGNMTISGLTGSVEAKAASGDIKGLNLKGTVYLKCASGNIQLADFKGEADIVNASGDLTIKNAAGNLSLKCATGNVEAENLSDKITIKNATGDINGKNLRGDITLKVATGDIVCKESQGSFIVKAAMGDIMFKDLIVKKESVFKIASGSIKVSLGATPKHNITLATASGDATLSYNGNPIKGQFQFSIIKGKGKISAPFKFDKEEEYEKWGKTYVKKSFSKGGKSPLIIIKSASGKVTLKK